MPVGTGVVGLGVVEGSGDLGFDPVLQLTDATVDNRMQILSTVYAFPMAGKTARVDVTVPYIQARWKGDLAGEPAQRRQRGFGDPRIRLSVNFVGAPAMKGEEYMKFRKSHPTNTVVGAGVAITLPMGKYHEDKLLNLGQNRYTVRPQLGFVHTRGPWSYELTGSVFLFSDNNDFFGGMEREQDPLYALQTHVVRTFDDGWWAAAGLAYGWSGRSTVEGDEKDDRRGDVLSGCSFGFPVAPNQSVKFGYLRRRTTKDVGVDSDSFVAAWSMRF